MTAGLRGSCARGLRVLERDFQIATFSFGHHEREIVGRNGRADSRPKDVLVAFPEPQRAFLASIESVATIVAAPTSLGIDAQGAAFE